MRKFYANRKLKEIATPELIEDLYYYIKNTKQTENCFDIEISMRGAKLDGNFISLFGGKTFKGSFSTDIMNTELYLTLQ
jgi:hypothetical protein